MDTPFKRRAEQIRVALKLAGFTQSGIARDMGMAPSSFGASLLRPWASAPVRLEVARRLGWHPWPEYAPRDGWDVDGKTPPPAAPATDAAATDGAQP